MCLFLTCSISWSLVLSASMLNRHLCQQHRFRFGSVSSWWLVRLDAEEDSFRLRLEASSRREVLRVIRLFEFRLSLLALFEYWLRFLVFSSSDEQMDMMDGDWWQVWLESMQDLFDAEPMSSEISESDVMEGVGEPLIESRTSSLIEAEVDSCTELFDSELAVMPDELMRRYLALRKTNNLFLLQDIKTQKVLKKEVVGKSKV
ncbi:hypothetical protein BpHYR1_039041 [Brachionus plicatilis]|uniref:Uncharacterized protein n=1 Tax=Brachionus plicatilis TaxID=10195 RepID=A0A3M7R410_BRAPC|nr:hypothetical protein BpHYR1_039041 [Brachionus plicatilis]